MPATLTAIAISLLLPLSSLAAEGGPLSHWDFNEGRGEVAIDRAGGGHDGHLHRAAWEHSSGGGALRLAAKGSFVAVPRKSAFDLCGDLTLVAWVKPLASPFANPRTNYVILASSDCAKDGFVIRVEGEGGRLRYVGFRNGGVDMSNAQTALGPNQFHQVAFTKKGDQCAWYVNGRIDGSGRMPRTGPIADELRIGGDASQSFDGLIDDVKLYDRALSSAEVLRDYRRLAGAYGRDTSQFGKISLRPFLYLHRGRAMAEVDYGGILPLETGQRVVIELVRKDGTAVEARDVKASLEKPVEMFTFDLGKAARGRYELRTRLLSGQAEETRAAVAFDYPPAPVRVPSPQEKVAAKLPTPPPPLSFTVKLARGGGFVLCAGDEQYPVESRFSFPHGGENVLGPSKRIEGGPSWRVRCKAAGKRPSVVGECAHYRIRRELRVEPHRLVVSDTVQNLGSEALGIILRNQVLTGGQKVTALLGGRQGKAAREIKVNPTVFLSKANLGLGMVALDDVFIVQSRGFFEDGRGGISTREFALDGRAAYTLQWAIYPNSSGDYFDFINLVRRDEKRGGVTVEGGFAFYPTGKVPSREYLEIRGLKYFSAPCLSRVIDDPSISLEGIEFLEYPKVRAQLRRQFQAVTALDPTIKCMFHIAHALYATDEPEKEFPDARLVDAKGRQHTYGNSDAYYYGGSYFTKERLDQGWRWWIFYPTRENSFGKAMLRSVDVMVDEIGCRGAFMDGFMWNYGSPYTYNQWDGHSADIDAGTKTISRKKGSVLLLSQGLLAEYVRRFNARGGTVVANYPVFTRTIAREKMVCDQECRVGPDMHLTHTPITLGRAATLSNERHVYRDVREALASGNLYFYYGEGELTTRSVPAYMYPITIEDIRAGCVSGRERIVTLDRGTYAWPGSAELHQAWLFDGRGALADHAFFSTVDSNGVRTELPLEEGQTAVLGRLPIQLKATLLPVNVHCGRYDAEQIRLTLHGRGTAELIIRDGEFAITPGSGYSVTSGPTGVVTADGKGVLRVHTALDGLTEVIIGPAAGRQPAGKTGKISRADNQVRVQTQ